MVLHFAFGAIGAAKALVAMILLAVTLESVFALCIGCKVFRLLMRTGVIPERVCADCSNIWARQATA